ncbi:Transcriptional regulator prz1 [Choanephora cucurbitarum]|uniref:Transcriptional regulator prz1 n=1 Tax=Choanephora cucurbitarum TaxID=101091 RepID=A0A1C7NML4_9FUNG|nr:Transcriptional regulator prz1 [Choanephora cucurbitarum]
MYQGLSYFEPYPINVTKRDDFSIYSPFPLEHQESLLLATGFCPPLQDTRYIDVLNDPLAYQFTSPPMNQSSCSSSPSIDFHSLMTVPLESTTPDMWPAELPTVKIPVRQDNSNPKPFACHLCTRCFARKHDLQRHIRVHTGAKPYSCLSCSKAFARTDALKRHLRVEDSCRLSPVIQAMKNTGSRRYRNL